nr:recombinase family protein [Agrococcus sp. REN33]
MRASNRRARPRRAMRSGPGARRSSRTDLRRSRTHGRQSESPRLERALAPCRAGDSLVVMKLDRLARSLPDAHASPV